MISGPSGVGKGTIVKKLLAKSDRLILSVSCTTRPPRASEREGVDYFFVTREKFLQMREEGGFLESNDHFKGCYGTPRFFVEEKLKTNDVVLEIEVNGALNVKSVYPEALLIMIAPPSRQALASRLKARGTEKEEEIEVRLERADFELSYGDRYDYTVVNDDLDVAVDEILKIIDRERETRAHREQK